jgi:hypothetical protein
MSNHSNKNKVSSSSNNQAKPRINNDTYQGSATKNSKIEKSNACGCGMPEVMMVQAMMIEKMLISFNQAQERVRELEQTNLELARKLADQLRSKSKESQEKTFRNSYQRPENRSIVSEKRSQNVRRQPLASFDQPKNDSIDKPMSRSDSFQKNQYNRTHQSSPIHVNASLSNLNYQVALDNPSMLAPPSGRQTGHGYMSNTEHNFIPDDIDVMMYKDTEYRESPRIFDYLKPQAGGASKESRIKRGSMNQSSSPAGNYTLQDSVVQASPAKQTVSLKEVLSLSQPVLKPFESDIWATQTLVQTPSAEHPGKKMSDTAKNNNHHHLSSGRYVLEKIREDLTQEVSNPTSGRRRSTLAEIETRASGMYPSGPAPNQPFTRLKEKGSHVAVTPTKRTGGSKYSVTARMPVKPQAPRSAADDEILRMRSNRPLLLYKRPSPSEECIISSSDTYDIKIALRNYGNLTGMLSQKKEAAKNYALSLISEIAGVSHKPKMKKSASSRTGVQPHANQTVDIEALVRSTEGNQRQTYESEPSHMRLNDRYIYTPSNYRAQRMSEQSQNAVSEGLGMSRKANVTDTSQLLTVERSKIHLEAKNIKLSDEVQSKLRTSEGEVERESPTTFQPSHRADAWNKEFCWGKHKPNGFNGFQKGSQREVYSTYM